MTRLDRLLNLLERYDGFAQIGVSSHQNLFSYKMLEELRKEREKLTQELLKHGCRRKN
jgi:hypothetical protein